ncbi:MAG: hypothetical protein P4K83_04825 [Terracidiphilus sp.]|nr:hypothetical protein [Terracidiphilus sp.]
MTTFATPARPEALTFGRRRRIDRKSGQALEILGHAIEYLTDEFVHDGGFLSSDKGQLEAVQLLMAVNREIYFECPQIPTLGERMLALMGIR